MKKFKILTGVLAVSIIGSGFLSACSGNTTKSVQTDPKESSVAASNLSADTNENVNEISEDVEKDEENKRRNEIAQQYSIYEKYGMTYNKEKDRFFYDDHIVRYFKDCIDADHNNSFFFDDGTIDVEPVRNANGELTGLKKSSDEQYADRTQRQQDLMSEYQRTGLTDVRGSYEAGDSDWEDDSLKEYASFGVVYDKSADTWTFDHQIIHILYDETHNTYCNAGATDGVNLKVIRNKNGDIEKLIKVKKADVEKYVK